MNGRGRAFSLYARKTQKGPVWYAKFKAPGGSFGSGKNTGCATRKAAESWALRYLQEHGVLDLAGAYVRPPEQCPPFREYAADFFRWEGPWSVNRRASGRRHSLRSCREKTAVCVRHVFPAIGDIPLDQLTTPMLKAVRNHLFLQGRTASTINKVLGVIRAVLDHAEEEGVIRQAPRIERAGGPGKTRGVLTLDEARAVLAARWEDHRAFTGNLLAASTGLRLGEIQALTREDIDLDNGIIHVRRSWDEGSRHLNATTKNGRERRAFITTGVKAALEDLLQNHPDGSFIFYSDKTAGKPAEQRIFTRGLYRALNEIGISETERQARNITFHSWRHWFNSLLINARVPLQKIQTITGHLTAEMAQVYYHADELDDVHKVVSNALN